MIENESGNPLYNKFTEQHYQTMQEFANDVDLTFLVEIVEDEGHSALGLLEEIELDSHADYKRGYNSYLKIYEDSDGGTWGIEYSVDNWGEYFDVSKFQKYKQKTKIIEKEYWSPISSNKLKKNLTN